MRKLLFTLTLLLTKLAVASPTVEILAYGSDHGSWPADNLCFPANSHFAPFQGGWVLPQTCVVGDDMANQIWFVRNGQAQKLATSAVGNFFTDPTTDGQTIALAETSQAGTLAITQSNLLSTQTMSLPANWSEHYLGSLNVISPIEVQFRFTYGDRQSAAGSLRDGKFTQFAATGISYYFGAATSAATRLEVLRMGQPGELDEHAPDQIILALAPQFSPVVVARDHDADPTSAFTSFYNKGAVQGHRWAAFAQTAQGPVMLRGLDATYDVVPLYAQFKAVDYFAPAVLNDGRVALRGTDLHGVIGLWIIDLQNQAHLLLQKGTSVNNDRGQFVLGATPFVTGPASSGDDVVIGVDRESPTTHEPMEQDIVRVVP